MAKLHDLFTQARRSQSSGGMGFIGKTKTETKARSSALVVELSQASAGNAEAALKAGANGLLFTWDGQDSEQLEQIKNELDTVKTSSDTIVSGVRITKNIGKLDRDSLTRIKDLGIQYVLLPFDSPVRLLAQEIKDLEIVVTVPVRDEELYPLFIRGISTFSGVSAVLLDFPTTDNFGAITIEQALNYQSVRESLRYPAFCRVQGDLSEDDVFALSVFSVQALIVPVTKATDAAWEKVRNLGSVLAKVQEHLKENNSTPTLPTLRK